MEPTKQSPVYTAEYPRGLLRRLAALGRWAPRNDRRSQEDLLDHEHVVLDLISINGLDSEATERRDEMRELLVRGRPKHEPSVQNFIQVLAKFEDAELPLCLPKRGRALI